MLAVDVAEPPLDLDQRALDVARERRRLEDVVDQAARLLPAGVATHAVGDRPKPEIGPVDQVVLVLGADQSDVGPMHAAKGQATSDRVHGRRAVPPEARPAAAAIP